MRRLDAVLERASGSEEEWQEAVGVLTTLVTAAQQEMRRRILGERARFGK